MKPETLKKIDKAYDKFYELHYWLHEIENNYHNADQFRWLHNVFINTYQILLNQVCHALKDTSYKEKYTKIKEEHWSKENLFKRTTDQRNTIVHEEDLKLNSSAFLCLISNKKGCDKFRLSISNNNSKDSDLLIIQTLKKKDYPFYETFMNNEDYDLAVYREWKINQNDCILKENRELLLIMSNFIHDVFILTGHCINKENPFHLECCPPINNIKYKIYDRNELIKKLV
jgi:hypothetical protein